MSKNIPLIIIAGPTASGKSETAVALAAKIGGEIISADAMQVYRGMDIGSAKITPEEMAGIPHHLIDVAGAEENFDVVRYAALAKDKIREIHDRGHIPILCGGTGFYIQAVVRDIDFENTSVIPHYREELQRFAEQYGNEALHERLRLCDPKSADRIHPNNVRRVVRALEYFHETGGSIAEHNEAVGSAKSPYETCFFVLNADRQRLYERINQRVDVMMQKGLLDEVRLLKSRGLTRHNVSMQGLGYKELLDYLDGKCSLEEAVDIIKRDSRHYAKRQITWFKREKEAVWIDLESFDNNRVRAAGYIESLIENRLPEWRKHA